MRRAWCVVGVDVGGTSISAGVVTSQGKVLTSTMVPTRRPGASLASHLVETLQPFIARYDVHAIGLGVPGTVNFARARIVGEVFNLPELTAVPLRALVQRQLQRPIVIDNDVNAMALAEQRWGAARGVSDFVLIALGTGVGGAIVLDGRLRRGAHGHAGEIGHATVNFDGRDCFCGSVGCLKAYAAGPDLSEQFADVRSRAAIDSAARALGAACANVIHTIDPQLIVIGGSVASPALVAAARKWARRYTLPAVRGKTKIARSQLTKSRSFLGAAALALDYATNRARSRCRSR